MKRQQEATARSLKKLAAMHPGTVVRAVMDEAGVDAGELATAMGVSGRTLGAILRKERGITRETAGRLGCYFGTSAEMWLYLQGRYEREAERVRNSG